MNKPKIGAHVSIAKGLVAALDRAQAMQADCIQIFSSSPRSFDPPRVTDEISSQFKKEAQTRGIGPNFIHATYLINLGSDKSDLRQKSVRSLVADLIFADKIGARGSIVHTGSHGGVGFSQVVPLVSAAINQVLDQTPAATRLFLEIAAGGKGKIGVTFEELEQLLEAVNNPRLGVCLDTAHLFAGGFKFETREEVEQLAQHIASTVGWARVGCIHSNDSKGDFGSHIDRHENIGKGKIGLPPFKLLLKDPKFSQVPFVLEVPGFDDKGPDGKNIEILKSLF